MRRLKIVSYESSVQLCLQTARIPFEYQYPNVLYDDYTQYPDPRIFWILTIILQLVSVFISALSTFKAIFNYELNESLKRENVPLPWLYLVKMLQGIVHVGMGTVWVFLSELFKNTKFKDFCLKLNEV